jgi:hypothetical protein
MAPPARPGYSLAFQLTALGSAVALGAFFAVTEHALARQRARRPAVVALRAGLGPEGSERARGAAAAYAVMDASVPAASTRGAPSSRAGQSVSAGAGASAGPEDPPLAATLPGTATRCPAGTVLVEGEYCPRLAERCLQWADDDRRRCLRFAQPMRCVGRRRRMAFCMDRYEWPNARGARPAVMVTWLEAEQLCRGAGRRLCTQDEWTFACEGEQMLPYGYGFSREPDRCTVDHFATMPDRTVLDHARHDQALAEAERVYEASPSGSHPGCTTPFGAYDLVGNVDEWTVNESGWPFRSALKGGWWGRIRGRCRPATLAHYERFRYYQIGFRCCADDAASHPPPDSPDARARRRHRGAAAQPGAAAPSPSPAL